MIDLATLDKAERRISPHSAFVFRGSAHGLSIEYRTEDPDVELWVSPIFTMREKGVALVNNEGTMVANVRRDR
jgi:hypothetical protein